jgi:hypothetical protein
MRQFYIMQTICARAPSSCGPSLESLLNPKTKCCISSEWLMACMDFVAKLRDLSKHLVILYLNLCVRSKDYTIACEDFDENRNTKLRTTRKEKLKLHL